MPDEVHAQSVQDFIKAFREAGQRVHHDNVVKGKAPVKQVINALVEASYRTLAGAILSRLILSGKVQVNQKTMIPTNRILNAELIAKEIFSILEEDFFTLDPKHEYSVGMVKHERRG